MLLTGKKIDHVNSITHDGKVVVFGTALDGAIYYSVKRSGFEESALATGADPFGFEDWQSLSLGDSVDDPSVIAYEKENLSDTSTNAPANNILIRSMYGKTSDTTKAVGSVQLVSSQGHIYVFRQAPSGKVIVNRFVLDGMANKLVPKLEVRFRRSRQRLTPLKPPAGSKQSDFDNLDYRDIEGNPFYEPALELGFAEAVKNGGLSVVLVPTNEVSRSRWHIFTRNNKTDKLMLHTVGSGADGLFDIKDYTFRKEDPVDPEAITYRAIPGIIRRTIDLKDRTIEGCPSATVYDIQKEVFTETGPKLVRETMRVMVAVPSRASSAPSEAVKTVVVDFAIADDGTLSQVDLTPDEMKELHGKPREVITPLSLMDGIKEFGATSKAPEGIVSATERSDDKLLIRSKDPLPSSLESGAVVNLRGTQSYNGHYKVINVSDAGFVVEAKFENNEAGFWEVVPEEQTGLVFDNMIVGAAKTADGKLSVLCSSHDLKVGDEVKVAGTEEYDGTYPILSLQADGNSFVLDAPFFTGVAANLSKVARRGLRMTGGQDQVKTPELELPAPRPNRDFGRTLSAWVRVDSGSTQAQQSLIKDRGQMMELVRGADNKVTLITGMSGGAQQIIKDPKALPLDTWVHYATTVEYVTARGGETRLRLYRDGVEVAKKVVAHWMPCHLGDQALHFDGVNGHVEVPAFLAPTDAITVTAWVCSDTANWNAADCVVSKKGAFTFSPTPGTREMRFGVYVENVGWKYARCTPGDIQGWHVYTGTYDGEVVCIYVDGFKFKGESTKGKIVGKSSVMAFGRDDVDAPNPRIFKGQIAGVELWSAALSDIEVGERIGVRPTLLDNKLLGYWPLDNGATADLSPSKRHGSVKGFAEWKRVPYFYPDSVKPRGAKLGRVVQFDGSLESAIVVQNLTGPGRAFTVSLWALSSNTRIKNATLWKHDQFFELSAEPAAKTMVFKVWIAGTQYSVQCIGIDLSAWHLYTVTYDKGALRFYVDGIPKSASSAHDVPTARSAKPMTIAPSFSGWLADLQVWGRARSEAEIKQDTWLSLTGKERDLIARFPLDETSDPRKPSVRKKFRQGELALATTRALPAAPEHSVFVIGEKLVAEIAQVQIWSEALPASGVAQTMQSELSGMERGLVAYYRMGAIVYGGPAPVVPDSSVHGWDGEVAGSPYAAARRLKRATGWGLPVVKYGSTELVAVSQRGTYEERFEFRVSSPSSTFDPCFADGTKRNLFRFSYWGKSSRNSKDIIPFPPGAMTQLDFTLLTNNWYEAKCRVVVPDGVSVMRAFEIADVIGLWKSQETAPQGEWTTIDVRRHTIRLVSDAISRHSYTDEVRLSALPAQSQADLDTLAEIGRQQEKAARSKANITDLEVRLDVVKNVKKYTEEKKKLEEEILAAKNKKNALLSEIKQIKSDPLNYCYRLRLNSTGDLLYHTQSLKPYKLGMLSPEKEASAPLGSTWWMLQPAGGSFFYITSGSTGWRLRMRDEASWRVAGHGRRFHHASVEPGVDDKDARLEISAASKSGDDVYIGAWDKYYLIGTLFEEFATASFKKEKTEHLIGAANNVVTDKIREIRSLEQTILDKQSSWDALAPLLAGKESADYLKAILNTERSNLRDACNEISRKNANLLGALKGAPPATMEDISKDRRGLSTAGAVLDFAQPASEVLVASSCEGNVQLTYIDTQGRMRRTVYDATSDSRNATFEQWLPDGIRACARIRDSTDKIVLDQAVTLPRGGFACEVWALYPFGSNTDVSGIETGTPWGANVLAAADHGLDAPLVVKNGTRLGLLRDGWFFDSGADLSKVLAPGWHHLAVSSGDGITAFYADGVKLASRSTTQPALRSDGKARFFEVAQPAQPPPVKTVEVWARSAKSAWSTTNVLVCVPGVMEIKTSASGQEILCIAYFKPSASKIDSSAAKATVSDIKSWHHYAGTYDGTYLREQRRVERWASEHVS